LKPAVCHLHDVVGINSFASNGECGLKQRYKYYVDDRGNNSFASNGECGLKRHLL